MVLAEDLKETGRRGIFNKLKIMLERNRIGELLVLKGVLTPHELRYALARQKQDGDQLGRVLVQERLVTRRALYKTLAQQWTLRCLAGAMTLCLLFTAGGAKSARAASVKDIPAQIKLVSTANAAFAPVTSYPGLFGYGEKASTDLSAFTKWTSMFGRFEAAMSRPSSQQIVADWKQNLSEIQGQSLKAMVRQVHELINAQKYISDNNNWGQSDYWATPIEFFTRGGDCEDYAIAKYVSLRALGVPEDLMRIAIVHDKQKDIPHAVLVVYADGEPLILDNQNDRVLSGAREERYKPIFSINRHGWWLHSKPKSTVIASAE